MLRKNVTCIFMTVLITVRAAAMTGIDETLKIKHMQDLSLWRKSVDYLGGWPERFNHKFEQYGNTEDELRRFLIEHAPWVAKDYPLEIVDKPLSECLCLKWITPSEAYEAVVDEQGCLCIGAKIIRSPYLSLFISHNTVEMLLFTSVMCPELRVQAFKTLQEMLVYHINKNDPRQARYYLGTVFNNFACGDMFRCFDPEGRRLGELRPTLFPLLIEMLKGIKDALEEPSYEPKLWSVLELFIACQDAEQLVEMYWKNSGFGCN